MAEDQQNDLARALAHNRKFRIDTRYGIVVACHNLHSLLKAQSRGLVVAAVSKLPGDELPEGVYLVLVTCRRDVNNPDSGRYQNIVSHGEEVWEMARCTTCDCRDRAPDDRSSCTRLGILFKFKPSKKTVYDPFVWPDERLAPLCLEAYNDAKTRGRCESKGQSTYWEGKTRTDDGKEYWMAGYVKTSNEKMKTFFFIPSNSRKWPEID